MSQKTTRASAREIRRAFGPAAVASLAEHDEALAHHAQQIKALVARIDIHRTDNLEALQRQAGINDAYDEVLTKLRNAVFSRSFFGRLRWLFTGK